MKLMLTVVAFLDTSSNSVAGSSMSIATVPPQSMVRSFLKVGQKAVRYTVP